MKKSRILMVSALMAFAFAFASCGSTGEKAKEEVNSEQAAKDSCDQVAKDTCANVEADTVVVE